MTYHNTNAERGATLAASQEKTEKQEVLVLKFFREHRYRDYAAHQVHEKMKPNWPFWSTRRAITNLQGEGKLDKKPRANRVMGEYGKKVFVWGLPKPRQLEMFNANPEI